MLAALEQSWLVAWARFPRLAPAGAAHPDTTLLDQVRQFCRDTQEHLSLDESDDCGPAVGGQTLLEGPLQHAPKVFDGVFEGLQQWRSTSAFMEAIWGRWCHRGA